MTEAFQKFKSDDVEGLVDEARLAAWLDEQELGVGQPMTLRRISGGMSNESIDVQSLRAADGVFDFSLGLRLDVIDKSHQLNSEHLHTT